jgi:tetratricopeptide (TPR) repeat protein
MTNKTSSRSDLTEFDSRVGQAWSQHNQGHDDVAIEEYRRLLEEWPDHVDANYGLALALKARGDKSKALDAFAKTRQFVEAEMAKATGDTSRYHMLMRMIDQHMTSLKA